MPRKSSTWMVETRVTKTATKRDDYTRLQNLNALFSVIGSSSTSEETLQLQRTLSFMRENDEDAQMSVKSFEHCIEQVVRFHFPQDRSFPFTHWNARSVSIDPLWVRASVLDFIKSFQGNMRGLLLVSGLREYLMELRVALPVSTLAKYKTAIQMVAIAVLLADEGGEALLPGAQILGLTLLWIAASLTLLTGYDYVRKGIEHAKWID